MIAAGTAPGLAARCAASRRGASAPGARVAPLSSQSAGRSCASALGARVSRCSQTQLRQRGAALVVASAARGANQAAAVAAAPLRPEGEQLLSGLEAKALHNRATSEYPSMQEVLRAIPAHCFERNTLKSLGYAVLSTAMTLGLGVAAYFLIPLQAAFTPLWIAYALVTGTVATGCWVVAHECGHGAFSDNKALQDAVGYVLHSALLVPYFSWQRSHAVHHSRTNHVDEGETHVPMKAAEPDGAFTLRLKAALGEGPFALLNLTLVLAFGWPAYLLTGASGGPVRGKTNHFWPWAGASGKHALFPGKWAGKVLLSDVGVLVTLGALAAWAVAAGSVWPVVALYVGPYMVTNAWLVLYTWLQHTDVDVPHYGGDDWSQVKGAFMTIDRPYGPVFDFLHHRIGSTHVAHHVNHTIPHYHALEATNALKAAFPHLYLYDPTPVHVATWRVGSKCTVVRQRESGEWVFAQQ